MNPEYFDLRYTKDKWGKCRMDFHPNLLDSTCAATIAAEGIAAHLLGLSLPDYLRFIRYEFKAEFELTSDNVIVYYNDNIRTREFCKLLNTLLNYFMVMSGDNNEKD